MLCCSGLSEEDLKRKADGLFQEFTSTLDKKEALACVQELKAPVSGVATHNQKSIPFFYLFTHMNL